MSTPSPFRRGSTFLLRWCFNTKWFPVVSVHKVQGGQSLPFSIPVLEWIRRKLQPQPKHCHKEMTRPEWVKLKPQDFNSRLSTPQFVVKKHWQHWLLGSQQDAIHTSLGNLKQRNKMSLFRICRWQIGRS